MALVQFGVTMKLFLNSANPFLFVMCVSQQWCTIWRFASGNLTDNKSGQERRGGMFHCGGHGQCRSHCCWVVQCFCVRIFAQTSIFSHHLCSLKMRLSVCSQLEERVLKHLKLSSYCQGSHGNCHDPVSDMKKTNKMQQCLSMTSLHFLSMGPHHLFTKQWTNAKKPGLLMDQMEVSELHQIAVAKTDLTLNDCQLMSVFASALDQIFEWLDGTMMQKSMSSFLINPQSRSCASCQWTGVVTIDKWTRENIFYLRLFMHPGKHAFDSLPHCSTCKHLCQLVSGWFQFPGAGSTVDNHFSEQDNMFCMTLMSRSNLHKRHRQVFFLLLHRWHHGCPFQVENSLAIQFPFAPS